MPRAKARASERGHDRKRNSDLKHAWAGGNYHRGESDDSDDGSGEDEGHGQNASLTMRYEAHHTAFSQGISPLHEKL